MKPTPGAIWASAAGLGSDLLPVRPWLRHAFHCVCLCKKPDLNYFQTGKNRNTDIVQSKEYWIGGKLDNSDLCVQFHIQPQLFWTSRFLWCLVGCSKPFHLPKPQRSVRVSSAQGWEGCAVRVSTARSAALLSVSQEQNSHPEQLRSPMGDAEGPQHCLLIFTVWPYLLVESKISKDNSMEMSCQIGGWHVCCQPRLN